MLIAGALLGAAEKVLTKGIHPMTIAEAFQRTEMSTQIDLSDKNSLLRAASTSLNSKVIKYI